MKLRSSLYIRRINKKKISFRSMLNSEFFFQRSAPLKMALNKNRMVKDDFNIKRVKSTIGSINQNRKFSITPKNKHQNTSFNDDRKKIPFELGKILDDYQLKFANVTNKYNNIHNENQNFLNYFHYINFISKKKQRELLFKKYFLKMDKNEVNLNSDEVKKISEKLFKSNPLLMYRNNSDMFFHFLSEMNEHKNNETELKYIKEKHYNFLRKLNQFLEYVKIKKDSEIDKIAKVIKLKSSKYVLNYDSSMKYDQRELEEKNNKLNKKIIFDSLKMIKQTKNTLKAMDENQQLFEDPNYLLDDVNDLHTKKFYNSYTNFNFKNNFFTPKKATSKMNSTASTGFFIISENANKNKNRQNSNIKMISIKKNCKKKHKEKISKSNDNINFFNNQLVETISQNSNKNISIKKNQRKLKREKTASFTFEDKNANKLIEKIENNNLINKISNNPVKNNINISSISPINNKNIGNKKLIFRNKKNKCYNSCNDVTENKDKLRKLFDKTKIKIKMDPKEMNKVKKYFNGIGKKINLNLTTLDLIKKIKNVTDKLDIEKNCKKVLKQNISSNLSENLKNVKNINKKVNMLDVNYMKDVFFFEAKNDNTIAEKC